MSVKRRVAIVFMAAAILFLIVTAFLSNHSLRLLFHHKVWAHRVNSIQKMQASCDKYSGLELDVVFVDSGSYFDISHPPDTFSGLRLKDYLLALCKKDIGIWLDFKNLNNSNQLASLNQLISLCKESHINPSHIIIESKSPGLLQQFSEEGFRTSYYLPVNLHLLNREDAAKKIDEIKSKLARYHTDYISTEYKDYPVIKKHFPDQKKLLWFTVYGSMNKISARMLLYNILKDDKVDVLLLPFSFEDMNNP